MRVLLVDDHVVVRAGLRMLLEGQPDLDIVGEAGSGEEALHQVAALQPDVVIMDIGLPDMTGIEATRQIRARWPRTLIVALTIHEDQEYFFRMLEAGASGYVPKRAAPQELLGALRVAASGEVYLYPSLARTLVSEFLRHEQPLAPPPPALAAPDDAISGRETEVLALLADGTPAAEIAARLSISPKTVARHRENIMRKLGLRSRAELVKYAIRCGIINA